MSITSSSRWRIRSPLWSAEPLRSVNGMRSPQQPPQTRPRPHQFVEAFFGLKAQAEKLQRIEDRLERVAVLAEESASPNAVAQVAAQQLRSVEVGARVAGVGGYGTARATDQPLGRQTFSINIMFASTGETVSINTPVQDSASAGEIPGELDDE